MNMKFSSTNELKNYILTHSQVAVEKAREKVALVINHFLSEFYKEFDPDVYERTEQLLNSLIKTDVVSTANGWVAKVYFDLNELDYSWKLVNGQRVEKKNWSHIGDTNSDEQVLETAMIGDYPHGGYKGASGNTQIWIESMKILNKNGIKMLKEELIRAGIPVKYK